MKWMFLAVNQPIPSYFDWIQPIRAASESFFIDHNNERTLYSVVRIYKGFPIDLIERFPIDLSSQ